MQRINKGIQISQWQHCSKTTTWNSEDLCLLCTTSYKPRAGELVNLAKILISTWLSLTIYWWSCCSLLHLPCSNIHFLPPQIFWFDQFWELQEGFEDFRSWKYKVNHSPSAHFYRKFKTKSIIQPCPIPRLGQTLSFPKLPSITHWPAWELLENPQESRSQTMTMSLLGSSSPGKLQPVMAELTYPLTAGEFLLLHFTHKYSKTKKRSKKILTAKLVCRFLSGVIQMKQNRERLHSGILSGNVLFPFQVLNTRACVLPFFTFIALKFKKLL